MGGNHDDFRDRVPSSEEYLGIPYPGDERGLEIESLASPPSSAAFRITGRESATAIR